MRKMTSLETIGNIRKAEVKDLSRLTEIYNQAILTQQCTCDLEVLTTQQRQMWFDEHQTDRFPIFVYEIEKKLAGYAYISPYRAGRKALINVCEVSYYIDFGYHRKGIGSNLMGYTIEYAKQKGFRNIIAILLECNSGSIALLKKFGFSEWGVMPMIAEFENAAHSHIYYGRSI